MEEQTFGQESVERSLGYVPANVEMPESEPQGDISLQETELRDAANEIVKDRNQRQREVEGKPVDAVVEVRDTSGRKLPENETLSVEEASHLVTGARNKEETTVDLNERDELAREIDALRNGVTTEQLHAEPVALDQQVQPQPEVAPHIAEQERMAKVLADNPQLLAGIQQQIEQANAQAAAVAQQYQQAITHNAHVAAAALVSNFPELQNLQPHEIGTAIQVIGQRDPQRAQQIVNFIDRIHPLVNQAVQVQQAQQQRTYAAYSQWQANQQAQFQRAAKLHDEAFEAWEKQEGLSDRERQAIRQEARAILLEGGSEQQIAEAWNGNWALRNATAQIALAEAARARLARRGAESKLKRRPVPHVQRPGSPEARIPDGDIHLGRLEKQLDSIGSAKAAAELLVARRARAARR